MRKVQSLVYFLLLGALALFPIAGLAQSEPRISSLEIAIWPEYDRPAALVIYQLRFDEGVDLPATVSLPLPEGVAEPHAVAAWYPDGALDDSVTWSTSTQAGFTEVEVTTETSGIWLEFYDDLEINGAERRYDFTWSGALRVESLSVEVLHPIGSTDLTITPGGEEALGADGLTYTQINLGARAAGEDLTVEMDYQKTIGLPGVVPTPRMDLSIAQLEITLWPEFDQPETLVIYQGSLPPESSLPAILSLPIPASAGEPTAVAFLGADNQLYLAEYVREQEGDWAWINFETESSIFQIEFYDDLDTSALRRAYSYYWPGVIDVGLLSYEVQQPVDSRSFKVTPAGVLQVDASGLAYVRSNLGPQAPGSELAISFEYEKDSARLTSDTMAAAPDINRPATTQGGTPDLTTLLPYFLGGFGLLLILVAIILFTRVRAQKTPSRRARRRTRKPKADKSGSADLDAAAVFCHVCGTKASASDHFCRSCGTRLRT
jgi:hypothetical protein